MQSQTALDTLASCHNMRSLKLEVKLREVHTVVTDADGWSKLIRLPAKDWVAAAVLPHWQNTHLSLRCLDSMPRLHILDINSRQYGSMPLLMADPGRYASNLRELRMCWNTSMGPLSELHAVTMLTSLHLISDFRIKKTRCPSICNCPSPRYRPTSPIYSPTSPRYGVAHPPAYAAIHFPRPQLDVTLTFDFTSLQELCLRLMIGVPIIDLHGLPRLTSLCCDAFVLRTIQGASNLTALRNLELLRMEQLDFANVLTQLCHVPITSMHLSNASSDGSCMPTIPIALSSITSLQELRLKSSDGWDRYHHAAVDLSHFAAVEHFGTAEDARPDRVQVHTKQAASKHAVAIAWLD